MAAKEKLILELQALNNTGITAAQAETLNLAHTQLTVALEGERKKGFELANKVEVAKASSRELKLKLRGMEELHKVLKHVTVTTALVRTFFYFDFVAAGK